MEFVRQPKRFVTDTCHVGWDVELGQAPAIAKGIGTDIGYAFGNL